MVSKTNKQLIILASALLLLMLLLIEPRCKRLAVGYLYINDFPAQADVILVLNGGNEGKRAGHAVDLFQRGYAPKVMFSGSILMAGGDNAKYLRKIALRMGLPADVVLIEPDAASTYENILFSKKILQKNHMSRVLLVTSPLHQRRAFLVASSVLEGTGIRIINSPHRAWFSDPDSPKVQSIPWRSVFREYVKISYYYVTGRI